MIFSMRLRWQTVLLVCGILISTHSHTAEVVDSPAQDQFKALLEDAELVYSEVEGFYPTQVTFNSLFQYEHALENKAGDLEIRYAIRPLSQIIIDYDDPHSATPEPNHIYPLMFSAITDRLSGAKHSPSNEYSNEQAAELFNADWAAVSVFDVQEAFSSTYSQGTLVAMHANKKADAYLVFLFNDYTAVKKTINKALSSLKFEEHSANRVASSTHK